MHQKVFVPYVDESPAAIEINGHRLLIVRADVESDVTDFEFVGATEIREYSLDDDDTELLASLASQVDSGVVIAPPEMPLSAVIADLQSGLPWLH